MNDFLHSSGNPSFQIELKSLWSSEQIVLPRALINSVEFDQHMSF
jgi:hypothetical protein